MKFGRREAMVGGTFFLAAATGHVMQNGDAIAARLQGAGSEVVEASLTSGQITAPAPTEAAPPAAESATAPDPALPELPGLEPAAFRQPVLLSSRLPGAGDAPSDLRVASREYDTYGQACADPALHLSALKPAMLGLTVTAACHAGDRVRVSHGPLQFTARLDDKGRYTTALPALAMAGQAGIDLPRGVHLEALRPVTDIGAVMRLALVGGGGALHLSATMPGAAGPIDAQHTGLPTLGLGGFLTRLGEDAAPVEVLTLRPGAEAQDLRLTADVTAGNCGRDLAATVIITDGHARPTTQAVSFAMPDCGAVGQRVMLDAGALTAEVAVAAAP